MSNLLCLQCMDYGGITTKIRAMEGRLITPEMFHEMASLESVPAVLAYLRRLPAYRGPLAGLEEKDMHRGQIEHRLALSLYQDFTSIYHFADLAQRRFLDLFFVHFDISLLKQCLHKLLNHKPTELDTSIYQPFFERHSRLDIPQMAAAGTLDEWVASLDGTPYHALLSSLEADPQEPSNEHSLLFDYEMKLDLYYFQSLWKAKNHFLSRGDQKIIEDCFGTTLDLLNLQWIYRAKQYYHLPPADIYALLVPIHHRLPRDTVAALVESASMDEFWSVVRLSYYGQLPSIRLDEPPDAEALNRQVLDRIYRITRQRNPYSIACIYSYLYLKELEMQRIITTIECIRYGVPNTF